MQQRDQIKIWLLTNTPSPYQVEFFSSLHHSGRVRLDVRFMRLVHRGEPWQPAAGREFPYVGMRGLGPERWPDEVRLHPRALREVLTGDYDYYVLSGHYTSLTFVGCAVLLWLRRRRWAMWLERPWPDDYRPAWSNRTSSRSALLRWARRTGLRALVRMTSRMLCIGTAAVEAYRQLGAAPEKLALLPYICDVSRFNSADAADVEAIRHRHRLEGKTVYLFSGQLVPRKGVDALLAAFVPLAARRDDVALVILGDGPQRGELESGVPDEIADRVHFAGHVAQAHLPAYFAASNAFVFPSRHDGWGVVINEACAAGLPLVTMECVGAAHDLVLDGQNGFLLARDDVCGLEEKMEYLASHPDEARRMGERSRAIVERFSPESGIQLLLDGLRGSQPSAPAPAESSRASSARAERYAVAESKRS